MLKMIDNCTNFFKAVAVCPISKQPLSFDSNLLSSPCGFSYKDGDLRVGLDFAVDWKRSQDSFELWQQAAFLRQERLADYYRDVDADLVDVYEAIKINGRVLDVGGAPGLIVKQAGVDPETYISVDAYPFIWSNFLKFKSFASHYRELEFVCRVPAFAEFLPIATECMDVVHMRSCLDHFANPRLALLEAYRVLVRGGRVVVGISLEGAYKKINNNTRDKLKAFVKRNLIARELYERIFDHHLFHPTRESVTALVSAAGFVVTKEYWQQAYSGVLYLEAAKR